MRHRRFVMALLGLGVIGGYGSGIAHLACMRHHWQEHQQAMMNQFAHTCVDAARTGAAPQGPQYAQPQGAFNPYGAYGPQYAPPPGSNGQVPAGPWGWNR